MLRSIWFMIKVAIVIAIGLWAIENTYPIAADIHVGNYRWIVETQLTWLLLYSALALFVLAFLHNVWRWINNLPEAIRNILQRRRQKAGIRALAKSYLAISANDTKKAEFHLKKADRYLKDPSLTLPLKAEKASIADNSEEARKLFEEMSQKPSMQVAGLRGLLEQAQLAGNSENALVIALRLQKLLPKMPWVIREVFTLQTKLGLWADALETLHKAVNLEAFDSATAKNYRSALLAEKSRQSRLSGNLELACKEATAAQEANTGNILAAITLGQALIARRKFSDATSAIEKTWTKAPHPELASLYIEMLDSGEPLAKIKRAERLVELSPNSHYGHLALGKAFLEASIWGEARRHLMRALVIRQTAEVYRTLAQLEEAERQAKAAAAQWLAKIETAAPECTWRCHSCNAEVTEWHAVCGACGGIATIFWENGKNTAKGH